MKWNRGKNMHTFFLESTLVLFCFSLVSIVIITAFLKADTLNKQMIKRAEAMAKCVNHAEWIRGLDDVADLANQWYYDENWEQVEMGDATFKLYLTQSTIEGKGTALYCFDLAVEEIGRDKEPFCNLVFSHYVQEDKYGYK